MNKRQTSQSYWDENWRRAGEGLGSSEHESYFWRRLDRAFMRTFEGLPEGALLIELGCGGSEWLPRLHRLYSMDVAGLDYSVPGCERAREILAQSGVSGEVVNADMFEPPENLVGRFDVVCSFGLVEHFTDTADTIRACSRFGKPGSVVFTLIPNMTGLNGLVYKVLDRAIYETHVPLTLKNLREGHELAGLEVMFAEHLLGLPGILDTGRHEPVLWRRVVRTVAARISQVIWWLEERGFGIPENAVTSPYMVCVARVPE